MSFWKILAKELTLKNAATLQRCDRITVASQWHQSGIKSVQTSFDIFRSVLCFVQLLVPAILSQCWHYWQYWQYWQCWQCWQCEASSLGFYRRLTEPIGAYRFRPVASTVHRVPSNSRQRCPMCPVSLQKGGWSNHGHPAPTPPTTCRRVDPIKVFSELFNRPQWQHQQIQYKSIKISVKIF